MSHIFLDREAIPHATLAEINADIEAGEKLLADIRSKAYHTNYEEELEHQKNLSASEDHLQLLYDMAAQLSS